MNEQSPDRAEQSFEAKIQAIKSDWNAAMLEIVHAQYRHRGLDVPKMNESEMLERAPYLLESATSPTEGQEPAKFIVLTAPTGVGKNTVGKRLEADGVAKLPRVNTRSIRPGEVEGKDYFFVDDVKFAEMVEHGEVFCATSTAEESKEAHGKGVELSGAAQTQAGIPRAEFQAYLRSGQPFYIDSGAGTARKIKSEPAVQGLAYKTVFLLPPSIDEMLRRVLSRRQEEAGAGSDTTMSDVTLLDRLTIAVNHLRRSADTADGYVVNDRVERAAKEIQRYYE
ncbi:MAG: hypothetical protein A2898_03415 [Candidatus Kerfeldbacteria bacterium RIFCSPLOWO2_01_FULL_48_11]|uniref:Guanylate kinase-like domain-containing protein n=1 Tax=Candidatus Kerfeldbacteria bacterium RIFCSPLOWO2_01_FULL_48_11 TaxID=1798543 RepID=A0A1G2B2A4_9BACT|nr:MAG: Guanylate kinase [Parcubacteria group bacterium GW2011_GWA2_48_9]OGY83312.1 MAG: hypothetical protein A2898_03415 [Candidatus Kerfeldbacteria bacterium RIFCSPLOWO2_01_FULL_48_11]HCM67443.1 hypothetical protein [Candidatus Kerfeldbacteria bacterium]